MQVEKIDRDTCLQKESGQVGCTHIVCPYAGGFQVEGRGGQTAGIHYRFRSGVVDQAEQQPFQFGRFIEPVASFPALQLFFAYP